MLERRASAGDLPDPACEVVLPQQDCVCITASALVNQAMPRLLELSVNAFTVLIGPSLPLSPVWFDFGVDLLAGTVVDMADRGDDIEACSADDAVCVGGWSSPHGGGALITLYSSAGIARWGSSSVWIGGSAANGAGGGDQVYRGWSL